MRFGLPILFALGILGAFGATRAHATYIGPDAVNGYWSNQFGTFQTVPEVIYGATANGSISTYDAGSQFLSITGSAAQTLNQITPGVVLPTLLTASAFVERNTGDFLGGAWALLAGVDGAPELNISPGALLMQGSFLDLTTGYVACGPGNGYSCPERQVNVGLLSVNFSAPELNFDPGFLHIGGILGLPIQVGAPWSDSWRSSGTGLGWWLQEANKVPEPSTVALVLAGLAVGLAFRRRGRPQSKYGLEPPATEEQTTE
jgi:hypothetical protein